MKKIGLINGSLRKNSFSGQLLANIAKLFPAEYELVEIAIGDLPLFNQDYDSTTPPAAYTKFRKEVSGVDAVVFVTPEHNRSIPAALKNALDVGSRPYGQSAWNGKAALVVSQSPGNLSGFGANHHLRQILVFLNMYPVQQPEAYIANSASLFNEDGEITNEGTLKFLQTLVDAFLALVNKLD